MGLLLTNIAFDCDDVLKAAGFWSAALERPLDDWSSEVFASIGVRDAERAEPAWFFNKVPEPKQAKNRVHLDLVATNDAAQARLVALGATVLGEHEIRGHSWIVMSDPEGNEFCLARKAYTGVHDA